MTLTFFFLNLRIQIVETSLISVQNNNNNTATATTTGKTSFVDNNNNNNNNKTDSQNAMATQHSLSATRKTEPSLSTEERQSAQQQQQSTSPPHETIEMTQRVPSKAVRIERDYSRGDGITRFCTDFPPELSGRVNIYFILLLFPSPSVPKAHITIILLLHHPQPTPFIYREKRGRWKKDYYYCYNTFDNTYKGRMYIIL